MGQVILKTDLYGIPLLHRGKVRELLDRLYTDWLKDKHGSHEKLAAAWQVEGQRSPLRETETLDTGVVAMGRVASQSAPHDRRRGLDQRNVYNLQRHTSRGSHCAD